MCITKGNLTTGSFYSTLEEKTKQKVLYRFEIFLFLRKSYTVGTGTEDLMIDVQLCNARDPGKSDRFRDVWSRNIYIIHGCLSPYRYTCTEGSVIIEVACPLGCLSPCTCPRWGCLSSWLPITLYLCEVRLPFLMVAYHLIPVRGEAACPQGCLPPYTCPR